MPGLVQQSKSMIAVIQLQEQLKQLLNVLQHLSKEQYCYKSRYLGNSSVGEHTRHIIELLQCCLTGYDTGFVDYINRIRDTRLETDITMAIAAIEALIASNLQADKPLRLYADDQVSVDTTYYRELVYHVEHIIHHLALIKVGLTDMNLQVVTENFGMAYSTIHYKKQQQQV